MSNAIQAPKFFWCLDNEVPKEFIQGYQEALKAKPGSSLNSLVSLIAAKVPVPPKAYLTSSAMKIADGQPPEAFLQELSGMLSRFERMTHLQFGGKERPLLLTVQGDFCGAIRNIGSNLKSLRGMIHEYGQGVAYSRYVDFLEVFSSMVLGCPHVDFRQTFGIKVGRDGGSDELKNLSPELFAEKVQEYQNLVSQKIGKRFPDSPEKQIYLTLIRCAKVAKQAGGDEILIKTQLLPSPGEKSTMGVAYTRNPFTGKPGIYGVYQVGTEGQKAQLEPVGSGSDSDNKTLRDRFPLLYSSLKRYLPMIEACFRDVMEVEFVSDEEGHLHFVNFDKAQVTARASVVSAIELNHEGTISDREVALRIKPKDIEVLLHPTLDESSKSALEDLGSTGSTAAPGTSVGRVFFRMADALEHFKTAKTADEKRIILICDELLISDTPGLGIIKGLVTRASGMASHAAVMARANGIPCIVGYGGIEIGHETGSIRINGKTVTAGALMTLEAGAQGKLYLGEGKLQNLSFQEGIVREVAQLVSRVVEQERIPMEIRVNINSAKDAETGLSFGADGVGLCRTENMFMEADAIREIRNIVFTRDPKACEESFRVLEERQFEDFKKIFQVMRNRVVNIRLMDLPLHDLVPQTQEDFDKLCSQLPHLKAEQIRAAADSLHEHNPMLGLRACRYGLINPEVYDMQIRAIVRAAYAVGQTGIAVNPGIMFPLVFAAEELTKLKARVVETERAVRESLKIPHGSKIHFRVGSMIELPAAALSADKLAKVGEFFAFGTNDLTQTTLGMSRDDSAHYLPMYLEKGLIPNDPFKVLAPQVRELVEIAVSRGHRVRSGVSFGICGEQGGDPTSLVFCIEKGLDYVSCSPFRVLPAKVALVHAALGGQQQQGSTEEAPAPTPAMARKAA